MIVKTDNQYYSNIASAIREKNETNIKYKPSEMAIAIENIENGGISCTLSISTVPNATVTATLSGTTVSAKADVSGIATLELPEEGVWTVTATADGVSVSIQVNTSLSLVVGLHFFPSEPSSYEYMALVTASQTWAAPEDGWFQIEVFGASGKGGNSDLILISSIYYNYGTGGGGGGGGYACSRIKMNKGDTIVFTVGAVGATTIADINSSLESYSSPQVTSGGNGTEGKRTSIISSKFTAGTGGAGGVASGGNYSNANGKAGTNGAAVENQSRNNNSYFASGGAGANGAPTGGASASVKAGGDNGEVGTVGSGSVGFIKIYRGNTNIA